MHVTKGSDNVFEDIGFEAEEAANLKVRTDLILDLRRVIEDHGWTQEQATSFFGETQSCISSLMKGELGCFSVDTLITMLTRAGMQITVSVEPKVA